MKRRLLILAVAVLLLLPTLTFGQTQPNLGATSGLALFTAGGAFDSEGATVVKGNIGSFTVTPTITGPGVVIGTIYNVGDPALNQPFADVSTAYTDLFSRVPDDVIGIELAGQTLTPGVHSTGSGSAATLTGNVTLNGLGNPNSLFIIQIDGALTTSTFSNVILINSASPNNVYWQITGAFTLGNSSVFRGNIVSGGAIELLDASSLIGRGLTKAGAIHLHNNKVTLGAPPAAPTVSLIQPTCSVGTGTITITAPTGVGMTYSINGSDYSNTTGEFTGLTPGSYNVTAMDSDGYVSLRTTVTINAQPTAPDAATAGVTIQPTCSLPTGTIVVTAPLGAGYEYNIDGGTYQTAVTFTGVAAGSHNILVRRTTDNTCISGATAVTVNAALIPANATASTTIQPTCLLPTGTIVVTAPLGAGYEYNIDGGTYQTAVTFAGVAAGSHNILVRRTADHTCISGATTVVVTAASAPANATASTTIQPTCLLPTGTIVVTAPLGAGYEYNIDGGTYQTAVTFAGVAAGSHNILVRRTTDNTCISGATAVVVTAASAPANATASVTIQPTCLLSTGTIVVTSPLGAGYEYNIDGGTYQTAVTFAGVTAGSHNILVRRTTDNTCISGATTVVVNATTLPIPTITGPITAITLSSKVYTTQAGMSGYTWTVSPGGTITSGTGTNAITITWNTTGNQTVSVNYTDANSCTAANPTIKNVTVGGNPTIDGPTPVCVTSTNSVYTTEAGMTNYVWTVSAGGIITAGAGTDAITVTWNTEGAHTVTVNYKNADGFTAVTPTSYSVTVVNLPVPVITGPTALCVSTTGNVYTTEAGMTAYTWTVSPGGTITAGGTTTDNTATITWNTAGPQTVSVNYNNATGCTAVSPTVKTVTVNSLPTPTINGPITAITLSSKVYTTQAGMSGYTWTVSPGGLITSGAGTNAITVKWNTEGNHTVSVNYNNANNCTAVIPTVINVIVGSNPTIDGPTPVCVTSTNSVYTTEAGMTNYVWTVSAGGTITAGAGTDAITVTWNTLGAQTVTVNYKNTDGITAVTPTSYSVTVVSLPVPAISGPTTVCVTTTGNIYTTEAGMTAYTWTVSPGGTITTGGTATDNTATITWNTAGPQTLSVNYNNAAGCTAVSPTVKTVTVNTLPTPTITGLTATPILSSTVYTTQAGMSAYIWSVSPGGTITAGGTATDNTATITWNTTGAQTVSVNYNNANNCTAVIPAVINVTVANNPTIIGPTVVCVNSTNSVYTTEAGMTNYIWTVSAGGTITAGAGTNAITVNWNTVGAKTVTVNYTNGDGVTAPTPTVYNVTVVSLPVPVITGPTPVCIASTGNVYTTEAGMTPYTWTVSPGGTITAGGTATDNTATITWNAEGAQTISVNYTNATGCVAGSPTVKSVTVIPLPTTPTYTLVQPTSTVLTGTITVITPTGIGMTYSIDGITYTNTTGIFTELPGTYSITAMNADGCISTPAVVTIVAAKADLSVVNTVNNEHPIIGKNVVFTIVATNNGPDIGTGVTLTDVLQSGYTYVSSTTTKGTYEPSTGLWTIGTMNVSATETLTITATINPLGNYVNTAIITGNEIDDNLENNTSTVITYPTDFFIPDGFSPNGDGINDLFVIRGIFNYPNNKIVIFNRWGNKVYEASPYQNTWDGRSMFGLRVGGDELPVGTYFYVLDLMDGSPIFKGTIYLNR